MSATIGRLHRRPDYVRVARRGRKGVQPGLVLQVAPRPAGAEAPSALPGSDIRVGFTVTRKVGNAVIRNRVRRRLKAVAAEVLGARARPGFDYVVIGRKGAERRAFGALKSDLERALGRLDPHRRSIE